jgi:hypothetical protein
MFASSVTGGTSTLLIGWLLGDHHILPPQIFPHHIALILQSGITITDVLVSLPNSSVQYTVSIFPHPHPVPLVTFCTFATICPFDPVLNVISSPVSLLNIGSIGGFCGITTGCHVTILIIGLPFQST